jgi:hypothetical protein
MQVLLCQLKLDYFRRTTVVLRVIFQVLRVLNLPCFKIILLQMVCSIQRQTCSYRDSKRFYKNC